MRSDWVTEKISDIAQVISGGTPSTDIKEFWDGDIVWVTPADLSKLNFAGLYSSGKKITSLGLSSSSATLVPRGSIVVSSRAPIGYFAIPEVDFSTNQGCKSIRLKNGHSPLFHFYNFKFNVEIFKGRGEGTTFAEISKKEIEKLRFSYPPFKKQQKIAKILSTCDAVIEKTEQAIAKYQAIKQGMMHDLFTRGIDLNTGKLRPTYQEAPALYKESELGMIPKEWEVVSFFKYMTHFFHGGTPNTKNKNFWQGEIPWVSGADFLESHEIGEIRRKITENAVINSATSVVPKGEILLVTRTGVGKLSVAPFDIAISQDITGLIVNKDIAQTQYLFYYLQILVKDFKKLNQGTSINGITRKDLLDRSVVLPSKAEQQLISQILLIEDQKIRTEQSTLAKYQQLKAGLMQDLLTGRVEVTV